MFLDIFSIVSYYITSLSNIVYSYHRSSPFSIFFLHTSYPYPVPGTRPVKNVCFGPEIRWDFAKEDLKNRLEALMKDPPEMLQQKVEERGVTEWPPHGRCLGSLVGSKWQ